MNDLENETDQKRFPTPLHVMVVSCVCFVLFIGLIFSDYGLWAGVLALLCSIAGMGIMAAMWAVEIDGQDWNR